MKASTSPSATLYSPIPAIPEQHLLTIAQLTSDAFAGGKYVEEISQHYIGNCHYDFDTSRLIFDGDNLIHHWGVWGYQMRLESIQLKIAGIGAVVTREAYRQQGLMALAAQDSFRAMLANGYDLSILRGRHYVKFGYARAWNYITYKLKPEEIPPFELKQPYRTLDPDHLSAIDACYNQSYAGFSGTAVRPTYRATSVENVQVYHGWFDEAGNLIGYVRAVPSEDQKTLQCYEAAGDPEQSLAVLAELTRSGSYETLNFFTLPQVHPILQIVRRGACVVENQYFHNTGWRVKLINLRSALGKMKPLLEARLKKSHLRNWQGQLQLDGGEQKASLIIEAENIQIADPAPSIHTLQAGAALGRFLIGSDESAEIIQQENIAFSGDAAELAAVLFPNLHPVLSHFDEF